MPDIKLSYATNVRSKATFEGKVEPDGSTGYKFSGKLVASCQLNRSRESFGNKVALGHSGTSDEYTYLEYKLEGGGDNTFLVEGKGKRKANDSLDFRLGFNEGLSGQYHHYSEKVTVEAGGPPQKIGPVYIIPDPLGNTKYDVRFDGTVRADGPTGYVIEGTLSGFSMPGALTTQYMRFYHKSSGGSWEYVVHPCDDNEYEIKIYGKRKAGEKIQVQVGATSKLANTYGYGDVVEAEIPEKS